MNLSRYQKLVLSIAYVLTFVIWLFPHWRVHAIFQGSEEWARVDDTLSVSGYTFLLTPPYSRGGSNASFWHLN